MQNPGPKQTPVSETIHHTHTDFSYDRDSEFFTEVFARLSEADRLKVLNTEVKKLSPDTQNRFKRASRAVFRTYKNAQRTLKPKRKVKSPEPHHSSTPLPRDSNRDLNQQVLSFPACPTIPEQEFEFPELTYDESHLDLSGSIRETPEDLPLVDTISNAADQIIHLINHSEIGHSQLDGAESTNQGRLISYSDNLTEKTSAGENINPSTTQPRPVQENTRTNILTHHNPGTNPLNQVNTGSTLTKDSGFKPVSTIVRAGNCATMPVQHSPPLNTTSGVQRVVNNAGHIAATVAQVQMHNFGPSPANSMADLYTPRNIGKVQHSPRYPAHTATLPVSQAEGPGAGMAAEGTLTVSQAEGPGTSVALVTPPQVTQAEQPA